MSQNTAAAVSGTHNAPQPAGSVLGDDFFAPAESDLVDGLLGKYKLMRGRITAISDALFNSDNDQAVAHFLHGNLHSSRGYHVPPVRQLFSLPGALASLNAEF